jgi:hypothetical protein
MKKPRCPKCNKPTTYDIVFRLLNDRVQAVHVCEDCGTLYVVEEKVPK